MKSLVTLHLAALQDVGLLCGVKTLRDEETLITRWKAEGDSFLTITLPLVSKALERALADRKWTRSLLTEFGSAGSLPAFMRGFFTRVFSASGELLDDPDTNSIWALRQVSLLNSKIERDCTPKRVAAALSTYIQTDRELGDHYRKGIPSDIDESYSRMVLHLFGDVFNAIERKIANFELVPRFGPGSTADRLNMPERWDFEYWPERLEEVFPFWRYGTYSGQWREPTIALGSEIPARVTTVPKTQKTPRIIAMEPASIQYAQQALKREFYREIGMSPLEGVLGFTDQERNQKLALRASIDESLATLDLSEASDRVHLSMVRRTFSRWPHLMDYLLAARSRTVSVNGDEIVVHKYASMGSALTFPFEAIVFTTIAAMGLERGGYSTRPRDLPGVLSVYGDDIVIPTDTASDVVGLLSAFGLKTNMRKSFWTGKFRESCGKEYYDGHDVTVVRLRADVPTSRREADLVRRFIEFRNRAYRSGLWRTVKVSDAHLEPFQVGHRHTDDVADAPSKASTLDTVLSPKWHAVWDSQLHRFVERHIVVKSSSPSYTIDGEGGILRWFLMSEDEADPRKVVDRYENQERSHTHHIKMARIERLPKRTMVLTDLRAPLN